MSSIRSLSRDAFVVVVTCLATLVATPAPADERKPPPMESFLGPARYTDMQFSPDGRLLAAIVPVNDRQNIALIDLDDGTATALTGMQIEDVAGFRWVGDRSIEFSTGNLRDALSRVAIRRRILIDTDGKVIRDLNRAAFRANHTVGNVLGGGGVGFRIIDARGRSGNDLIVATNERSLYSVDAYRYNPVTAERTLLTIQSPGEVDDYIVDHAGQVRVARTVARGTDKSAWWYRASNEDAWTKMVESDVEEEKIVPLAFDFDDRTLYVSAKADGARARSGIYTFDVAKRELGTLVHEGAADESATLRFDRVKQKLIGLVDATTGVTTWLDPEWDRLQKSIDAALPGKRNRLSWGSYATERILVTSDSGSDAPMFYLLERSTMKMQEVAAARPALAKVQLGTRSFVRYAARDGMSIPAFVTMPPDGPRDHLPLVVIIHGGPFVAATRAGFDAEAHFFASRGYAVLQPDFRGTQGYGDAFYKAGWKQWGLAMQDDVTDGVSWMIRNGVVDKDRVCLFGASYGGYATLWGLEKEPQMFRCGVAFVAVSDLELMFDVQWSDFMRSDASGGSTRTLTRWIGDPDHDRAKLREVSPLYHADRIQAPLLLAYGAADVRVPLTHGNQMRSALDKNRKPYEWVVYDDEGHGFNKDENRFDFYRRAEAFLAKNLAPR